jgi:hypothetical protein
LAAAQAQKPKGFESELEINDFPQNARWKVTHKGFQAEITELTGAAVTTKGVYIKSGGWATATWSSSGGGDCLTPLSVSQLLANTGTAVEKLSPIFSRLLRFWWLCISSWLTTSQLLPLLQA